MNYSYTQMPKKEVFKVRFGIDEQTVFYVKFIDGIFDTVNFSFCGPYTREQWQMLACIDAFITAREHEYEGLSSK